MPGALGAALADYVASSGNTSLLVNVLELAADHRRPRWPAAGQQAAMLEEHLAPARAEVMPQEWQAELAAGRALSPQEALALLRPDTNPLPQLSLLRIFAEVR